MEGEHASLNEAEGVITAAPDAVTLEYGVSLVDGSHVMLRKRNLRVFQHGRPDSLVRTGPDVWFEADAAKVAAAMAASDKLIAHHPTITTGRPSPEIWAIKALQSCAVHSRNNVTGALTYYASGLAACRELQIKEQQLWGMLHGFGECHGSKALGVTMFFTDADGDAILDKGGSVSVWREKLLKNTKAAPASERDAPSVFMYSMGHNTHPRLMNCGVPCAPLDASAGTMAGYGIFTQCMMPLRADLRKKLRGWLDFDGEGLCDLRAENIVMVGVAGAASVRTKADREAPKNVLYVARVVAAMNYRRTMEEIGHIYLPDGVPCGMGRAEGVEYATKMADLTPGPNCTIRGTIGRIRPLTREAFNSRPGRLPLGDDEPVPHGYEHYQEESDPWFLQHVSNKAFSFAGGKSTRLPQGHYIDLDVLRQVEYSVVPDCANCDIVLVLDFMYYASEASVNADGPLPLTDAEIAHMPCAAQYSGCSERQSPVNPCIGSVGSGVWVTGSNAQALVQQLEARIAERSFDVRDTPCRMPRQVLRDKSRCTAGTAVTGMTYDLDQDQDQDQKGHRRQAEKDMEHS